MNNTTVFNNNTIVDDNQNYWVALFALLNKTFSQYGMGLIWLFGNIGSIFTCLVFYQPAFRYSPCAMHFITGSFTQFFTFNFALLTRMLQYGYNIQTVNIVLWFCKIRFYIFYIFVAVPRYNIIMASVDCYFSSSRSALRRQWSSKKVAVRVIIGNIVFWPLMYTQVLIFYEIQNGQCLPRIGTYGIFFSIYISIHSGILPLCLMFIFGLFTVRNVRQTKQRIGTSVAIGGKPARVPGISKKDFQLRKMLINQICLFIILDILNPCYLVYQAFTINNVKSSVRRAVELFINNMAYALVYLGFALTFVIFLLSSRMFRREFQRFVQTGIFRRPAPPVTPVTTTVVASRQMSGTT